MGFYFCARVDGGAVFSCVLLYNLCVAWCNAAAVASGLEHLKALWNILVSALKWDLGLFFIYLRRCRRTRRLLSPSSCTCPSRAD